MAKKTSQDRPLSFKINVRKSASSVRLPSGNGSTGPASNTSSSAFLRSESDSGAHREVDADGVEADAASEADDDNDDDDDDAGSNPDEDDQGGVDGAATNLRSGAPPGNPTVGGATNGGPGLPPGGGRTGGLGLAAHGPASGGAISGSSQTPGSPQGSTPSIVGGLPFSGTGSSPSSLDYNFLSPLEKHDMLHGESLPAEPYFEEYLELVFPNAHQRSGNLDRCLVSALKVGFILPILDFHSSIPSFDSYAGAHAYYVVVSVNDLDGYTDLYRVAEYRLDSNGSVFASPLWLTFSPPHNSAPRSVIVVSNVVASTSRLPLGVRQALKDLFSLTAKGPTNSSSVGSTSSLSSDKSRASELRELSAAPLLRALHNDTAKFGLLVGPTKDVRDKSFLFSLRNRYSSSILQSIPLVMNVDHLELFVTFKWSRELAMTNKKAECIHLQLFKPLSTNGHVTPFTSLKEIMDALHLLETACIAFFLDERDLGFYGQVFYTLHRKLQNRELTYSISALPVDFLIYKISQLLIEWADLYGNPSTRHLDKDSFQALNVATLNFDPLSWRQEANNIPLDLLPRQFGSTTSSSSFSSQKKHFANKKRSKSGAFPDLPPAKKSASLEGISRGANNKRSVPKPPTAPDVPGSHSSSATPSSGKYICVADFLNKQRPSEYPACRLGSECKKRHVPKPAAGQFAAKDKAELLTSISRLSHLSGDQKAAFSAIIQAVA
jgi:hypothetical protein